MYGRRIGGDGFRGLLLGRAYWNWEKDISICASHDDILSYHSLQNRKVICSIFFLPSSPELDAGEAMMMLYLVG
jgi:hypothetical protein